jgi:hypothetical protein
MSTWRQSWDWEKRRLVARKDSFGDGAQHGWSLWSCLLIQAVAGRVVAREAWRLEDRVDRGEAE